jgi:ribosomal protein S12 methylthiotransferase accessory factor
MPTATAWAQACERLETGVRGRLGPIGGLGVTAAPLGVRDELAETAGTVASGAARREEGTDRAVPLHLTGRHVLIGPLGPGACPRCLARRWQRAREPMVRRALELGAGPHAVGEPPQVTGFGTDAVAALVAEHLRHDSVDDQYPYVYQLDLESLRVLRVRLVSDPDCPHCGTAASEKQAPDVPVFAPAPRSRPGSFRVADPADYRLPVDALVNPVCGVVGRFPVREIDLPTTSAVSGAFAERAGDDLYELYWGGHADGYGRSLQVGVMEGLERYAGLRPRGRSAPLVASYDDLVAAGDEAVLDPRRCGEYSPAFHAADPDAAEPFSASRPIPWVRGYSLRDRRTVLVPLILTYYHCAPQSERFVQECSNGCASGGSLAEAVLSGLCELIERDAFLLAWYGRVPLPELDPASSRRPATRQLVERLALYGYRARFFDTRLAFSVPVVTGVAVRTRPGLGALAFGAGASLDPEAALAAAVAEIATDAVRLRMRTEREEPELRAMAADYGAVRSLHDHPLLYGLPEMARHASFLLDAPRGEPLALADAFPGAAPRTGDLREDLAECVAVLTAAGFDTIVVDQSAPEQRRLGLHTASVIVPGLVPIDFGWSRQRVLHLPRLREVTHAAAPHPVPHPFP